MSTRAPTATPVSPEYVRVSDARVDVYAFGVMAFEMLAGRPPFAGRTVNELMMAHLTDAPPDLAEVREAIPSGVSALVNRSLRKQPAERPLDGGELLALLAQAH